MKTPPFRQYFWVFESPAHFVQHIVRRLSEGSIGALKTLSHLDRTVFLQVCIELMATKYNV